MKRKDYIFFIVVLGIMAILVLNDSIAIPCMFHKLTGLHCPGCGITRAVKALLKGNIYVSFRNNMLLYTVVPVLFIYIIISKITNNRFKKFDNYFYIILLIIIIGYGVLRNIPMFSYLAPYTSL